MPELWTVIDHQQGDLRKVSLQMLTAARRFAGELGLEPALVFAGTGYQTAKERLAKFGGGKVYLAESEELEGYLLQPAIDLLASMIRDRQPAVVLCASSPDGKDLASGV